MKPEIPSPSINIEQTPAKYEPSIERVAGSVNHEVGAETGVERAEQKADLGAIISDVNMTTSLPTPVISVTSVAKDTTSSNNPAVANDDDLIEKEWVDRAKRIVSETKNDPYQQEEAVSRLQIDYIKKRYGRDLGVAG